MNDMSAVIVAKSDQINADDLIAGPRVVTIKGVKIKPGTEQPVEMALEGTDKLFRPCKTVSRVIVGLWGADASQYVGKSLRLFRDPSVTWAGVKVGGIRIDQASDIESEKVLVVKESQKASKLHKIKPLRVEPKEDAAAKWADGFMADLEGLRTADAIAAHEANNAKGLKRLEDQRPELRARIEAAVKARFDLIAPNDGTLATDNPSAGEGRADEDMGEGE